MFNVALIMMGQSIVVVGFPSTEIWASVNSALILKTINLFLPCKLIFWKATKVGSPPNFPNLISQLRGIPQPQYLVPSLLEPHWTYLWKHYIYHKKDTKVGSQILATKFCFLPDWLWGFWRNLTTGHPAIHIISSFKCLNMIYSIISLI